MNGKEIFTSQKIKNNTGGQTIKLDTWSDAVKHGSNGQDILIIDVDKLTEGIVDHVIHSGVLSVMQQLSIRISYGDPISGIDYLAALKHLRKMFKAGFRIYWSRPEWSCIISINKDRTSCVYLDMVYHKCRGLPTDDTTPQNLGNSGNLEIPEDMMLKKLNNVEMLELYRRYLTSIQTHCKEVIRIGHMTDGGWNVCHDKQYRPSFPCLVYSFGISNDFSFDDYMAKTYGCEVHSFDPSINLPDMRRGDRLWFHNLGLSSVTGKLGKWKVSTLQDIFEDLNHTSRNVNVLKMDIENSEWASLPNIIQTGALRHTTQLLVEFHGSSASLEKLIILREIYNEGFRIYWYHRNPAKSNLIQGRFVQHSSCYEVYFVRM
ncbi:putative methyltransferase-like protein 24 [Mytilus galloprovincialis]|uniref:putative methyltransferase-like protein 24 n=1 Tax=Mytilus galloprovincialis TaxID=29158 RepID=UPI003F7BCC9F